MIVDQSGSVASMKRHDYLPFGEEIGGPQVALLGGRTTAQGYTGDSVRQHFTGYELDGETGLNYAQARYQSSVQGRFTSVDPLGASANVGNPQSFNRYSYVNNNPTNLTDPSGMMTGADASQSWGDVAGLFWGDSFNPNGNHFGGPAIVAAGEAGMDQRIQNTRDALAANAAYANGDYDTGDLIEATNSTLEADNVTVSAEVGAPQNPAELQANSAGLTQENIGQYQQVKPGFFHFRLVAKLG